MKILMVQNKPCVRNMRYAEALNDRGHHVDCAYTVGHNELVQGQDGQWGEYANGEIKRTFESKAHAIANHTLVHKQRFGSAYKEIYFAFNRNDLSLILSKGYDLVHSHNFPDVDTVKCLGNGVPVIYDAHDYYPWHKGDTKTLQGVATQLSDGRIFVTPYQANFAKQLFEYDEQYSCVFPNYTLRSMVPEKLPKLSEATGEIHLVYEGGASDFQHRDFRDIFQKLSEAGFLIDCHLTANWGVYQEYFKDDPKVTVSGPIPLNKLMHKMTQYDAGIMYFNLTEENKHHLLACAPNKMYEYWACGLPVITNKEIGNMSDQVKNTGWGVACDIEDAAVELPKIIQKCHDGDVQPQAICVEDNIFVVEEFYEMIVEKYNKEQEAILAIGAEMYEKYHKTEVTVSV